MPISNSTKLVREAMEKVKGVQTQLDQAVLGAGDSSAEAGQARVELDGTTHTTLKEHTDAIHTKINELQQNVVDLSASKGFRKVSINAALVTLNAMAPTTVVEQTFNVTESISVYNVSFDGLYTPTDVSISLQVLVDGILYKTYAGTFAGHVSFVLNLLNLVVGMHTVTVQAQGTQSFAVGSVELAVCL